jgi:hypothetical protein
MTTRALARGRRHPYRRHVNLKQGDADVAARQSFYDAVAAFGVYAFMMIATNAAKFGTMDSDRLRHGASPSVRVG